MRSTEANPTDGGAARRGGVILVLVVGIIAILAVLATTFLARMRQDALVAEDTVRLAQNRILLHAAMHYIQESSRLGYATMNPDGTCVQAREAYGWHDVRIQVPADDDFTAAGYHDAPGGEGMPENLENRRVGPRAADGSILWPWLKEGYDTGSVCSIAVTDGGEYTSVPVVDLSGGDGSGATAVAIVDFDDGLDPPAGPVVHVKVVRPGEDYTTPPTVTFVPDKSQDEIEPAAAEAAVYLGKPVPAVDATGRPIWPAPGSVLRVPFYRLTRPPWAVGIDVVRNPIPTDETVPTFGIPFLNDPDPLPAFADQDQGAYDETAPSMATPLPSDGMETLGSAWACGDAAPVDSSMNKGWFRIYREDGTEPDRVAGGGDQIYGPTGATFVITVGSGGTLGYRDWAEVVAEGAENSFFDSDEVFAEQLARERRQWYRVEWSGAVGGSEDHIYALALGQSNMKPEKSWFEQLPINSSRHIEGGSRDQSSASLPRNYIGTIRYIQRLPGPPSDDAGGGSNW